MTSHAVPASALKGVKRVASGPLLRWFASQRRILPWRSRRTPYRVWVAELMLQQTRVSQALPYYRRFMRSFPNLRALASASRRDVLKAWEGLGYYARARNMHDTAKQLVRDNAGRFPRTYEGLCNLPGIGPYTAAAIGSLAFNLDRAVLDGNVIRVLSRLFAYEADVRTTRARRQLQSWADELLPAGKSGLFNEAMMELGALVCLPRNPGCPGCPFRRVCRAHAVDRVHGYPVKPRAKKVPHKVVGAGLVVRGNGDLLIAQRKENAMLGGLWEFPGGTREKGESIRQCIRRELKEELGIDTEVGRHLVTVRHAYSHFTIELHVHWARIRQGRPRVIECADFAWVPVDGLRAYPFSRADLHIVQALENPGANVSKRRKIG